MVLERSFDMGAVEALEVLAVECESSGRPDLAHLLRAHERVLIPDDIVIRALMRS